MTFYRFILVALGFLFVFLYLCLFVDLLLFVMIFVCLYILFTFFFSCHDMQLAESWFSDGGQAWTPVMGA